MVLVDSNVIFDVRDGDPVWGQWSQSQILHLGTFDDLAINQIILAEISPKFNTRAALDKMLASFLFIVLAIPDEAAFLAGKAFWQYRKLGGSKTGVPPDFLIGAHAMVLQCPLLTRDTRRYATYFLTVRLIAP